MVCRNAPLHLLCLSSSWDLLRSMLGGYLEGVCLCARAVASAAAAVALAAAAVASAVAAVASAITAAAAASAAGLSRTVAAEPVASASAQSC